MWELLIKKSQRISTKLGIRKRSIRLSCTREKEYEYIRVYSLNPHGPQLAALLISKSENVTPEC